MNTKLTLKLDREVIERTKAYAKEHGVSLSVLVERYFVQLTIVDGLEEVEPKGLVGELAGSFANADVGNPKQAYADFLARKYA